jgi:hypothetical protein
MSPGVSFPKAQCRPPQQRWQPIAIDQSRRIVLSDEHHARTLSPHDTGRLCKVVGYLEEKQLSIRICSTNLAPNDRPRRCDSSHSMYSPSFIWHVSLSTWRSQYQYLLQAQWIRDIQRLPIDEPQYVHWNTATGSKLGMCSSGYCRCVWWL